MEKLSNKYRVKRGNKSIEAEEIFLDSEKIKKAPESEREKIEFPIKKVKLYSIYFLLFAGLIFLLGKAIQLQIVEGDHWQAMAKQNRIRSYPIKSMRGIIYDKNHNPLVSNDFRIDLSVIPADLIEQDDLDYTLNQLSEILKISKDELKKSITKHSNISTPISIKERIEKNTALEIENKFDQNNSILVETNSQRTYLDGKYFSHILGYLGKIDANEQKNYPSYLINDYIGKIGLEKYYEQELRGEYGKKIIVVDSTGKIKNSFFQEKPVSGVNIELSIDSNLQKVVYDTIQRTLLNIRSDRAAAIIMNANTGKILSMVSFPSFNNDKFSKTLSKKEFDQIKNDPSNPLFNRAISATYPPGSTIKPLIAVAALKENIVDPNQIINCAGAINVPNKYNPSIIYTFTDWKVHGPTNLIKAIAESCNVYFYTLGGGYGKIDGLGIEKIKEYLIKFGLGNLTGINLEPESTGLIPDSQWKEEHKNEAWYTGDTYNASIGQGDIMATPLQMTVATAAIANSGKLLEPQLISKVGDKIITPNIKNNSLIEDSILSIIRKGMREAIISGSAKYLYDLPIKVAGKTGTAQTPHNRAPHSWFIGFAPYENPEIVITILVENGGEGSAISVPIAKQILEWYFSQKK